MRNELNLYVHSSIPEYEHDGDDSDWAILAARSVAFGVGERNLVVLPDVHSVRDHTKAYSREIFRLVGVTPNVLYVGFEEGRDYFLDKCVLHEVERVKNYLNCEDGVLVWPYAYTPNMDEWMEGLRQQGVQIDSALPKREYFDNLCSDQHRGGWARWLSGNGHVPVPEAAGIPYPASYFCMDEGEVVEAFGRLIRETGTQRAFLKQVFGAGGYTSAAVGNEDDIRSHLSKLRESGSDILFGQRIPLELQTELPPETRYYSLQYANEIIGTPGGVSEQVVENNKWRGNFFNVVPERIVNSGVGFFSSFVQYCRRVKNPLRGWGGKDYGDVDNKTFMVEENGARVTGGHAPSQIARDLGIDARPFLSIRLSGNPNCDLETVNQMARVENMAMDGENTRGVFSYLWLEDTAFVLVAGDDRADVERQKDKFENLVVQNGYLK